MIPKEWLQAQVIVIDAEAAARLEFAQMKVSEEVIMSYFPSPAFTRFQQRWDSFVARMQPGDALWWFKSPQETWASLCGRSGFAIIRGSKVVQEYTTCLN